MRVSFVVILLLSLVCLALAATRPQKALAFKAKHSANSHIPRFRRQEVAEDSEDPQASDHGDAVSPPAAPVVSAGSPAAVGGSVNGAPVVKDADDAKNEQVSCNDCESIKDLFNGHLKTLGIVVPDTICTTVVLCPSTAVAAAVSATAKTAVPDKAADKDAADDAKDKH